MTDMREDVRRRLEDAGRTLMMLPLPPRAMPSDARSAWPDVLQKFWDQAGVADEGSVEERLEVLALVHNTTNLHASRAAVNRLDEVLALLLMIDQPHHRKAVFARMLTHPVSERPVYSWKQIAKTLGATKSAVRHWRERGIQEILEKLAEAA